MDVYVLRNFLAIAREGNITRAAESLHMAQSSLSKQLIDLENELGKKLLIRGKRKITLTEDGIFLRRRAEEIVRLVEKTERELIAGSSEISGEVTIGGVTDLQVLRAAAALRKTHPGIQFRFFVGDATSVMEQLDHGSLDFAVLLAPVDTMKYESLPLQKSGRWGLLVPCGSPLAEKAGVLREDFCRIPLISHHRAGLQREISLWAEAEPEDLNIAATYNVVYGSPVPFVQSGLGYFLTSEEFLGEERHDGVCFRPLDPPLELHYAFVWKRYPTFSKAAEAFLEKVKQGTGGMDGADYAKNT